MVNNNKVLNYKPYYFLRIIGFPSFHSTNMFTVLRFTLSFFFKKSG
jgi:hypothetical protein